MKKLLLPAVLLFAGPVAAAAPGGEEYVLVQDVPGVSGRVDLASSGGYRLRHTIGAPAGAALASPSGFAVSPGLWSGPALRPASETNRLSFGDPARPARLVVPPGALPSDWVIFASHSPRESPLAVSPAVIDEAARSLDRSGKGFTRPIDGNVWEILALGQDGARLSGPLRVPATLTLPYPDANQDGVVDGTSPPVREDSLAVWWLDEERALWVRLPDGEADAERNEISTPVRHFSVFTVMGAPSFNPVDAYAFPVPWRPAGPNAGAGTGQTGTATGGITFTNLPSQGTIRIFTLSGDLVREIRHEDGSPQAVWDGRNDRNEEVQTGTYIYVIESAGVRKTGKLSIIR